MGCSSALIRQENRIRDVRTATLDVESSILQFLVVHARRPWKSSRSLREAERRLRDRMRATQQQVHITSVRAAQPAN